MAPDRILLALRAGRQHVDGTLETVLDLFQIGARVGRQLCEIGDPRGRALPARHIHVNGAAILQATVVQGQTPGPLSVELIAHAQAQRVDAVQHVELGDTDPAHSVERHGAFQQQQVEPAAAARPAGGGAELLAPPAEVLADVVEQLGRERTRTDPRGIRLDDAQRVVDIVRSYPAARRGPARGGGR